MENEKYRKNKRDLLRGDVYYADLSPVVGCEQNGFRPVLVVQNDVGNYHSPTTIILPITTKSEHGHIPTHIPIPADEKAIEAGSIILAEQIRTIDKSRLHKKICHLDGELIQQVDQALKVSLGLTVGK
ncbi:MAG: type II toxin-antitoxin system PemK/MazF family toxin [Clostridiales bacterium]|nr:type II toxin-antitoxin system PemK/MazF family toxin [Clostridiales bacterium]